MKPSESKLKYLFAPIDTKWIDSEGEWYAYTTISKGTIAAWAGGDYELELDLHLTWGGFMSQRDKNKAALSHLFGQPDYGKTVYFTWDDDGSIFEFQQLGYGENYDWTH